MVAKWRMSGSLLGECNCDWGCPCSFDAPPTNGGCEGVYTWIVDKGVYGNVKLDGLALAIPGTWPGAVHLGHGTSVLVVDRRARPKQRKALVTLGKGEAGGPFAVFASVTERWLPTVFASFDLDLNGMRSALRIDSGKMYDLALSRIKNPVSGDEEEIYLDKPTGFTAKRSELGMSLVSKFKVPGLAFDNSGKYAEFSAFSYSGP
jgi:hypothetical protein